MLKFIVIAFTLKGQDQQEIFKLLDHVKELEPDVVLIHGFLPRRIIMEKQFSTDVVDKLDSLFPNQINLFNGQPLRLCMTEVATATRQRFMCLEIFVRVSRTKWICTGCVIWKLSISNFRLLQGFSFSP
jgi:hypothetical protein